ncbi:MAG: diacylglycerol kinase, partial [Rhizobiaceae bacterium]|nr:diacylglycerol kinase [Rhizobiaceae bacterium]
TANLLARDLGLPLSLDAAIAGLSNLSPRQIDVGAMNGRIYLHKIVVGFAPGVALQREKMRERKGLAATVEFLRYFAGKITKPRSVTLDVTIGEGPCVTRRLRSIAVANNTYDEGLGRIFARKRLDRGVFGVYLIHRFTLADLLRLSAGMLIGRWRRDAALAIETARHVEIAGRQISVQAMIDGEVDTVDMPLRFDIRPAALTVLAPIVAVEGSQDSADGGLPRGAPPAMATA